MLVKMLKKIKFVKKRQPSKTKYTTLCLLIFLIVEGGYGGLPSGVPDTEVSLVFWAHYKTSYQTKQRYMYWNNVVTFPVSQGSTLFFFSMYFIHFVVISNPEVTLDLS